MWLINTSDFTLREVVDPGEDHPYAILSHTWDEVEGDSLHREVRFQDMRDLDTARSKTGWSKIAKTCELAQNFNPSLKWAWIDTCCIDKSSSAELTEAINSMFRWYQEARVCFVYLSDLPQSPTADPESRASEDHLRDCFPRCRWLTRGWTLQELIAPAEVEFYDRSWTLRGTKKSLEYVISSATGIDLAVLRDNEELSDIPVARKMYWASHRETKRVEDIAYSLFGIFNVNMPLIYGEGLKAFLRLQDAIAQQVDDLTFFAWTTSSDNSAVQRYHGMFAQSPRNFASCKDIFRTIDPFVGEHCSFKITNQVLRFRTDLLRDPKEGDYLMNLYCFNFAHGVANGLSGTVVIRLVRTLNGFIRHHPKEFAIKFKTFNRLCSSAQSVSVSVPKHISSRESRHIEGRLQNAFRFRIQCSNNISVSLSPAKQSHCWDSVTNTFLTGSYSAFTGLVKLSITSDDAPDSGRSIDKPTFGEPMILACGYKLTAPIPPLEPRVTLLFLSREHKDSVGVEPVSWLARVQDLLVHQTLPIGDVGGYMGAVLRFQDALLDTAIFTPTSWGFATEEFEDKLKQHKEDALKVSLKVQNIEEDGFTLHEVTVRVESVVSESAIPTRDGKNLVPPVPLHHPPSVSRGFTSFWQRKTH